MKRNFLKLAFAAQAVSLLAFAAPVGAADAYPSKPIRMLVGYPAGSGIDNVARLVADRMEKTLGKQVYIDNKPGALSNIAAQTVASAAPDGYTILFTPNSAPVANVHLFKKLSFDPVKDFTPVAPVATLGFVVLVNPAKTKASSLAELTAMIKNAPGKYSYGTGNATGQVAGALYTHLTGADALNVPYKGVPPAIIDLIGGRIDFVMADASLAIPQVAGGRVKALAVTSAERIPALPDVPTITEAGIPDYDLWGWFGVFMPARAPAQVTQLLEKTIRETMNDPAVVESLRKIGVTPWIGTSEDLRKTVASDTVKWGKIIKRAGIQAQ